MYPFMTQCIGWLTTSKSNYYSNWSALKQMLYLPIFHSSGVIVFLNKIINMFILQCVNVKFISSLSPGKSVSPRIHLKVVAVLWFGNCSSESNLHLSEHFWLCSTQHGQLCLSHLQLVEIDQTCRGWPSVPVVLLIL